MAKSKKKKNADFQKVKLKVGKKLSKGDNITNLSFKTRQIQLTQTIRTGDAALTVTRKNLSIQDLLRQCDHHSVGPRVNAVSGIKELLQNNFAEFLIPSNVYGYGSVMKKLSAMLIDNESDVRHSVINLFKMMFAKLKIESQKMCADNLMSGNLFSHIHAYLCCAMNHIHEDVRLDSLILFDALLEAFPHAMVQQTGDLLKNLISMISSPISIGAKTNTVTQRLSMNPDSKLPVMKFRARVLLRIKLTLQVALLEVTEVDVKSANMTKNTKGSVWSLYFDRKCEVSKKNTLLVSQERTSKFAMILKGAVCDIQDCIIKPNSLEDFIKLSIPILLQCWKEARASGQNDSIAGNVLSADALEVMSLVVSVIELLFSLSVKCTRDFEDYSMYHIVPSFFQKENYESNFTQDFMTHFPYAAHIEVKQPKKRKIKDKIPAENTQSSLSSLNLCVCHIMSYLCTDQSVVRDRPWLYKIQQFVIKSFNARPSTEHNRLLTQILKNFFQNPIILEYFTPAFDAAFKYYLALKVKFHQKKELFNLFSLVLKQWDGCKGNPTVDGCGGRYSYCEKIEETFKKFVKNLTRLLLEIQKMKSPDLCWVKEILMCISNSLNGRGLLSIGGEIGDCLTSILDPVEGLLSSDDEEVQQRVLSLLPLGPALNKHQLKQVLSTIRHPATKPTLPHRRSCSLACQAITFISLGIRRNIPVTNQLEFNQMSEAQNDCLSNYLKFMFSLLIGMSREELEELYPQDDKIVMDQWKKVDYSVGKDQWERHMDLAVTVCQEMINLKIPASPSDGYEHHFTFISNMEQLWKHTLSNYNCVHIMSAYSLFKFIYFASLDHTCEKPSAEFYELTANIMACVLASFYLSDGKSERFRKEIVLQMKSEIITCLKSATPLLSHVCKILQNTDSLGTSKEEQRAASQVIEFLMTDDQLKTRINAGDMIEFRKIQTMDIV